MADLHPSSPAGRSDRPAGRTGRPASSADARPAPSDRPGGPRLVLPGAVDSAPRRPDPSQAAALAAAATASATLILGAPGTGKTTVVQEAALAAMAAGMPPDRVLVLAASRRAAARMRDLLGARAGRTVSAPMVRTAASVAFGILRECADAVGDPPPTLISGAEQDLVLADLLAGHLAGDGVPLRLPPHLPPETLGLRGFRQELRDLLMRAAERGLDPAELARLGAEHDRPEWTMAARLYGEYLDVTALSGLAADSGARYDPAVVVAQAARTLADWDEAETGRLRPGWDLVIVDDYQEATAAVAGLLSVLVDDGARLVLAADPDAAVLGFRGAAPGLVGRAAAPRRRGHVGQFEAEVRVLGTAWRQSAALRQVTRAVTEQIGTLAGAAHRAAAPRPGRAPGGVGDASTAEVRIATTASAAQEAAFVARELRAAHLIEGVAWESMAVIARTGSRLAAVRRALLGASVPVEVEGADVPLRDEPAVRPLLTAMRVATAARGVARGAAVDVEPVGAAVADAAVADAAAGDPVPAEPGLEVDAATAAELLCSPIAGLDAVGLRRLRRALRAEELAGGGGRASDDLLVELLADPTRAATLPAAVRRAPLAVARALAAGRAAARADAATAAGVLWAIWAAAGLAEPWREAALGGGPAGARADRDLDAVLALFRAAATFDERMPGAAPGAFVASVQAQDVRADTLAARAAGPRGVAVLTPAGAAGREWDVVAVVGVQDGVWPDLRLRDCLLGSQALAELLAGRSADAHGGGPEARRAVLADELRSFAVATSRARRRLLVTAVDDADDAPSPLCDLVDPDRGGPRPTAAAGDPDIDRAGGQSEAGVAAPVPERRPHVVVGTPLDLRGVVGAARRVLVAANAEPADPARPADPTPHPAARLLAALAAAGVPEANPDSWYGATPISSSAPLRGPQEMVPVSPSKVEAVSECSLRWVLEAAGGTAAEGAAQTLGNLVHAIAQTHPSGTRAQLRAELDRRLPELGLRPGWTRTATERRAAAMVDRLADYLGASRPVAVEREFRLDVGRARLRGTIDRVEAAGEGAGEAAVRVADLKTGRTPVTAVRAKTNAQLGAYQLAVAEGALGLADGARSAGARLVYVGGGAKAAVREQEAISGPADWPRAVVEAAAEAMAGADFIARPGPFCTACPVSRSCPAHRDGRQVVQ